MVWWGVISDIVNILVVELVSFSSKWDHLFNLEIGCNFTGDLFVIEVGILGSEFVVDRWASAVVLGDEFFVGWFLRGESDGLVLSWAHLFFVDV